MTAAYRALLLDVVRVREHAVLDTKRHKRWKLMRRFQADVRRARALLNAPELVVEPPFVRAAP